MSILDPPALAITDIGINAIKNQSVPSNGPR
jgi:hypothetical protein